MKKKNSVNKEIDLLEIFLNFWYNKLKIFSITFIFIFLSTIQYFLFKPSFSAKTEIIPITIFENNLYSSFNSLIEKPQAGVVEVQDYDLNKFKKIDGDYLLNLFLEELQTREIIANGIKKYQIIDRKKFKNEEEYLDAIKKKALKFNLLRPINVDGSKIGKTKFNWTIEFEINDKKQWDNLLSFKKIEINNKIKKYLLNNFNSVLSDLILLNKFKFEDIDRAITNEKRKFDIEIKKIEMELGFKLDDIKVKINNSIKDYEVETKNRLAFLTEQAAIARTLDIKKNTIESQVFSTQNSVITNVKTDTPYYLRGYEAIEKNIQLIKNRKNKESFVKNLFELEKQKRDLEKDKTLERAERNKVFLEKILSLENFKKNLLEDKTLERMELLFNNTPIVANGEDFIAGNIIYQNTEYKTSHSLKSQILIAMIIGFIFAFFYVSLSKLIQQRK